MPASLLPFPAWPFRYAQPKSGYRHITQNPSIDVNPFRPTQDRSNPPFLNRHKTGRWVLLAALLLGGLAIFAPKLSAGTLKLDFIKNGGDFTSGWSPVPATHLGDTMVNLADIGGSGYGFTFNHVATYDNNNTAQPLTRTGFYNFGRLANDHTFTLSGLKPGQPVALHACAAWDGNGAGGYVVFGDSGAAGVKAQTVDSPGAAPTLANLTYIGTATADGTGKVSGSLHGRDGVATDSEGQVGAFVFLPTQTITASAGANGSISPSGDVGVVAGSAREFAITAASGFHVQDVLIDGLSAGAVTTYTFTEVNSDHTISASFAADTTLFTINASAGANGSISPSGAVSANMGVNKPFTITPDPGYHVAQVLVDGVPVGAVGGYTFTNVIANHTISATFAINTYAITTSAGANGSIAPAGPATVNHGEGADFTITPAPGYYVAEVLVDGASVGAVDFYSFFDVTADHTITASFDNRTRLYLDFNTVGGSSTNGWIPVSANYVADTPLAYALDIGGLGYGFSFSHVGSYDNNQTLEPLTRSGFYNFANISHDHTFTLTGLNAGQTVRLYACAAWDGNGSGGHVVFGDSGAAGVKAQTSGSPGAFPLLNNMTLIGTGLSDPAGKVTGSLHGRDGVGTATEGQVGAFVFILEEGGTPAVNGYGDWAGSAPNNLSGENALSSSDPDFDGVPNLLEFALNGSPVSGASAGLTTAKLATVAAVPGVMTFSVAVRNGAVFSADGNRMKSGLVDGLIYTIEASGDLDNWGGTQVTEVLGADATAIQADLAAPQAGWTYKTFRTAGDAAANDASFIRVEVE